MAKWDWLEKPTIPPTWGFFIRVIVKAAVLFVVLNLIFAVTMPMDMLGRLSLYNAVLPGRERLPYGENPSQSYNISLNSIPAMFAAHEVAQSIAENEFRVLLIGDSATWGWLLENDDTLAGQINAGAHETLDGRRIVAYNLGYPSMTLTKDLLLLDYAMRYQPDMIVWPVTLRSFPDSTQFSPAAGIGNTLVLNNTDRVRRLIDAYDLDLDADDERFVDPDFWGNTIVGQRRNLADLLRLQFYGFSWAATGIDQYIPDHFDLRQSDFDEDTTYLGFTEDSPFSEGDLAFDVLMAGMDIAGEVPVLLINEPTFISEGENSDLRYSSFYPRWAYDSYREMLTELAGSNDWVFLDLWDALPPEFFTDTPVHFTPEGAAQYAALVADEIVRLAD
jgi:hypothetical protein